MRAEISDDFDLEKIASCGQCFRARLLPDGSRRFVTGRRVVYLRPVSDGLYDVSCGTDEWETVWRPYFDLSRDYRALRERTGCGCAFVREAVSCGCGLRILRQDPWETLVTFILSQRKNIPAIRAAVEQLARSFGEPLATPRETLFAFPTPAALAAAEPEALAACSLGYRAAYVRDAARKVVSGELDLDAAAALSDEALFEALQTVRGVGPKVANCVCLFAYARTARAPVDVWIARAIDEHFAGENPFPAYGGDAGIVQQYIFYYQKNARAGN
jgi:N-glycosylase/DNA lyase